jgi:hypothetical protein
VLQAGAVRPLRRRATSSQTAGMLISRPDIRDRTDSGDRRRDSVMTFYSQPQPVLFPQLEHV